MAKPYVTGYQGFFNPGQNVAIAQGNTISDVINCGGMCLTGIILPQVFTGTTLTFQVGDAADGYQASGQIVFTGTTTDGDEIEINSTILTFKDIVTDPDTQVQIGGTAAITAANLYAFLVASADAGLAACIYSYVAAGTSVMVAAIIHGVVGNDYTFDKSSTDITLTPSGGVLAGGGFRPLYNSSNSQVSMTVSQGRCYAVDPANFQGVSFLKLVSGSAELAPRTIVCTLKGF